MGTSEYACPSCAAPMRRQAFARRPEGRVELDICFACQSIWFDEYESSQLTPGATIELFRLIHEHGAESTRPISESARCPTCRGTLALTHDILGTNRIVYYRCRAGHGRLTAFFQFLREKQFVRSLSPVEIQRLRATLVQVRCSSCGGPVSVEKDAACPYCRSPLSILDADAVQRTLAQLSEQERRRTVRDPAAEIEALLAGQRTARQLGLAERGSSVGIDLVREALGLLTIEL